VAAIDCDPIRGLLAGMLYDELSPEEARQVDVHLAACAGCREALASMREAASALDAWTLSPKASTSPARRGTRRRPVAPRAGFFPVLGGVAAAAVVLLAVAVSLRSRPVSTPREVRPPHAAPAPDLAELEKSREDVARIEAERRRGRERLEQIEREFEQLRQEKKKEAEEAHRQALARAAEERRRTEEALDRAQDARLKAEEKLVRAESKGTVAVVAQLEWVQGEVFLLTPAGKVPVRTSKVFVSGQGLETAGANSAAVLKFPDSTRIELSPATTIREISDGPGGKRVDLASGSLKAEVSPQPAARPLTVRTSDAELRVMGTRFRLSSQDTTRVDVLEGKVRLRRSRDGASIDVSGGNTVATDAPRLYPKPLREVAFQDGVAPQAAYAGTRDAFLSETNSTHNYGTNPTLQADGDNPGGSGRELRMVLRWDTSAVPAGSRIQSATVSLRLLSRAEPPYEVHAIKRAWSETDVSWRTTAADLGPSILAFAVPATPVEYAFPLNAEGVALVQSWIDAPASNCGLMVTAPKTNSFGLQAYGRETPDASRRPRLVVTYTPR
jgi:ferric-dicitrate binding protein FerR (iron transport regulator)